MSLHAAISCGGQTIRMILSAVFWIMMQFPSLKKRLLLSFSLLLIGLYWLPSVPMSAAAGPQPFAMESGKVIDNWQILGPFEADDAESVTSAPLGSFSAGDSSIATDRIIWASQRPYSWVPARTDSAGSAEIRRSIGASKSPGTVFLYSRIQVPRTQQLALVLGANGSLEVWLNGKPAFSSVDGVWSPPGKDRWIAIVTLQQGDNHLLIRSRVPETRLPWTVDARFMEAEAFSRGGVTYPRWQVSSAPPWKSAKSLGWVRWGDPAVQAFLAIPATTATCIITTPKEKTPLARYRMTIGQPVGLHLLSQSSEILLNLRAELPPEAERSLQERIVVDQVNPTFSLLLGSAEAALAATTRTKESIPATLLGRVDAKSAESLLNEKSLPLDDARQIRGAILRRTIDLASAPQTSAKESAIPEGWLVLASSVVKSRTGRISSLVYFPANCKTDKPSPLVVIIPPLESDPSCIPQQHPEISSEASRAGVILAVPDLQDGFAGLRNTAAVLDGVRSDIERRLRTKLNQVNIMGFRDSAPLALQQALLYSRTYSGAVLVDGIWGNYGSWADLLQNYCPRPALYFAGYDDDAYLPINDSKLRLDPEDGVWVRRIMTPANASQIARDAFAFLQENALGSATPTSTDRATSTTNEARWLVVRQSIDISKPPVLSGDLSSTNKLNIQAQNVSQFDILVKDLPRIQPARPILVALGKQKLNVISQQVPEALRLRLVAEQDRAPHWEATEIKAEAIKELANEDREVAVAGSDIPALPSDNQGGIGQLLAFAARKATNAQIAVIPSRAIESAQNRGSVTFSDIQGWTRNAGLSTATVPTDTLIRAIERDYAGSRELITDGLVAKAKTPDDEITTGSMSPAGLFASTSLTTPGAKAVVVGWTKLLEDSDHWLFAEKDRQTTSATAPLNLSDCKMTQYQVLLRLVENNKVLPSLSPDITPGERKQTPALKEAAPEEVKKKVVKKKRLVRKRRR